MKTNNNRNDIEDYLYNNTRFERGSRSRHHFGSLYRGDDEKVYIKLNLQIRFSKKKKVAKKISNPIDKEI